MTNIFFWASYCALWVLTVALFAAIFFLYRYLGGKLLNGAEGRAKQGPEFGARLPSARLRDLTGASIDLGEPRTQPLFIFFASTTCEPCRKVLGVFGRFAEQYAMLLEVAFVCRGGTAKEVAEFAADLPANVRVVPDTRWDLGSQLRISSTPFALIVDEETIVRGKGMPGEQEDFEWFVEQLEVAAGNRPITVQLEAPVSNFGS